MHVCMAGKWVYNDFLLEQDGRNRTGDTALYRYSHAISRDLK